MNDRGDVWYLHNHNPDKTLSEYITDMHKLPPTPVNCRCYRNADYLVYRRPQIDPALLASAQVYMLTDGVQ